MVIFSHRLTALGNSKGWPISNCHRGTWLTRVWYAPADIVKMIESQPDLASQIRRVRGGYLKIQGTWMPYEVFRLHRPRFLQPANGSTHHAGRSSTFSPVRMIDALISSPSALTHCCSVAWPIRHDLVPLFGYAISKQHSVCSSESFDNLLVPHFPLPVCLQNNPDMGRSLPTAAVAVEPGAATMCKAQGSCPRVPLVPRLDGRSFPAQATHTRFDSRHPNFRTNRRRHLSTHPHGRRSTRRSS